MKPHKWRAFFRRAVKHQEPNMIQLTRLNNHPLVVNSDLIKFVEQSPDTVITLLSGEKIVVRESAPDVLDRVVQFRRSVLQGITPWSDGSSALPPIANGNGDPAGKEKE
jgi:flagellar protein FlbD